MWHVSVLTKTVDISAKLSLAMVGLLHLHQICFLSSVPSICCVVSSVSAACLLMQALLSVNWNSVCDGVWVCSCTSSKNSSNGEGLILA